MDKKDNDNEFTQIEQILKQNPKGQTISDVAKKMGLNRNSTAKYLGIMEALGNAEMKVIGTAKVFYPSDRISLSSFLNLTSEGIIILDENYEIIRANETFLNFINKKRENVLNRSIKRLTFPLLRDKNLLNAIEKTGLGNECNLEINEVIGNKKHYFEINLFPIKLGSGSSGIYILFKDITERKEIEKSIIESEEKLRTLFNKSPLGLMIHDLKGIVIDCNNLMEKISGLKKDQLIGLDLNDLLKQFLDAKLIAIFYDGYQKILKGEAVNPFVIPVVEHGDTKWYKIKPTFIQSEDKKYILSIVEDITEQTIAQNSLKLSQQKYKNLIENIHEVIIVINFKGEKIYVSPNFSQIIGRGGEVGTKILFDYIHPEDREKVKKIFKKSLDRKELIHNKNLEIRIKNKEDKYICD
jgi:PAS domain S-box-containing protein